MEYLIWYAKKQTPNIPIIEKPSISIIEQYINESLSRWYHVNSVSFHPLFQFENEAQRLQMQQKPPAITTPLTPVLSRITPSSQQRETPLLKTQPTTLMPYTSTTSSVVAPTVLKEPPFAKRQSTGQNPAFFKPSTTSLSFPSSSSTAAVLKESSTGRSPSTSQEPTPFKSTGKSSPSPQSNSTTATIQLPSPGRGRGRGRGN